MIVRASYGVEIGLAKISQARITHLFNFVAEAIERTKTKLQNKNVFTLVFRSEKEDKDDVKRRFE